MSGRCRFPRRSTVEPSRGDPAHSAAWEDFQFHGDLCLQYADAVLSLKSHLSRVIWRTYGARMRASSRLRRCLRAVIVTERAAPDRGCAGTAVNRATPRHTRHNTPHRANPRRTTPSRSTPHHAVPRRTTAAAAAVEKYGRASAVGFATIISESH